MKTLKFAIIATLMIGVLAGCNSSSEVAAPKPTDNHVDQGEQIIEVNHELTPSPSPSTVVKKDEDSKETQSEDQDESEKPKSDSNEETKAPDLNTAPDYYATAGIKDAEAFEDFFYRLQNRVRSSEKGSVALYVDYPFSYYQSGFKKTIQNQSEFIDQYDKIFTKDVIDAIVNQKINTAKVRGGGVMIGDGQVWLNASMKNDLHFAISSINN